MNTICRPTGPLAFPLAVALLAVLGLGACDAPDATPPAVFPVDEWERWESPEAASFSSQDLDEVRAQLDSMASSAMMVVTGGRVAFEYGDVTEVSYLASVRKSILAILYGIEVDRGTIDLDLTLADMDMDDVQGLTTEERQATARHLISSRSGIYHPASNPGDNLADAPERGSQPPGSYYLYSNWDFNAAGTAFETQTGRNLFDALEAELAIPLGMREFDRDRHVKGGDMDRSVNPSYHMHLSTRDMARIGHLVLHEGRWGDRQIVSPEWIREMTGVITPVEQMNPESRRAGPHGYGYMWWVWDGPDAVGPYDGAATGVGAIGQYITVLPALDMVVAHKTVPGRDGSVAHPEYWELLDLVVAAHERGGSSD